jgi:hypothetical protein
MAANLLQHAIADILTPLNCGCSVRCGPCMQEALKKCATITRSGRIGGRANRKRIIAKYGDKRTPPDFTAIKRILEPC